VSSIILYGADPLTREGKASEILEERHIHRLEAERGRIGIGQVKELLPHLYIKPTQSAGRGVLIAEAQQLTREAQHALLKTLEEPPQYLTFVLTTPHHKLLLPTVVSRCLLQEVRGAAISQNELAQKILSANPGQRIELFEKEVGYNPQDALTFLDSLEAELASTKSTHLETHKLKEMWRTKRMLRDQSTNVRLVIDRLLISW